ncbi:hypothetical protein HDV05_005016 [Chytridiales sp. JEL 0842]|nr:hypothetical protein HDV05_005016 [Chytridiales sp. JEL 0842]
MVKVTQLSVVASSHSVPSTSTCASSSSLPLASVLEQNHGNVFAGRECGCGCGARKGISCCQSDSLGLDGKDECASDSSKSAASQPTTSQTTSAQGTTVGVLGSGAETAVLASVSVEDARQKALPDFDFSSLLVEETFVVGGLPSPDTSFRAQQAMVDRVPELLDAAAAACVSSSTFQQNQTITFSKTNTTTPTTSGLEFFVGGLPSPCATSASPSVGSPVNLENAFLASSGDQDNEIDLFGDAANLEGGEDDWAEKYLLKDFLSVDATSCSSARDFGDTAAGDALDVCPAFEGFGSSALGSLDDLFQFEQAATTLPSPQQTQDQPFSGNSSILELLTLPNPFSAHSPRFTPLTFDDILEVMNNPIDQDIPTIPADPLLDLECVAMSDVENSSSRQASPFESFGMSPSPPPMTDSTAFDEEEAPRSPSIASAVVPSPPHTQLKSPSPSPARNKRQSTSKSCQSLIPATPLPFENPNDILTLQPDPVTQLYHCPHPNCDYEGSLRRYNLKIHYLTHLGTQSKDFVCTKCDRPFRRKYDARRHVEAIHHVKSGDVNRYISVAGKVPISDRQQKIIANKEKRKRKEEGDGRASKRVTRSSGH